MKKENFLFVLKVYLCYVLPFVAAKPAFMLYNSPGSLTVADFPNVIWHGLPMDLSTAGYFTLIPLLTAVLATWVRLSSKGLRIFLHGYFALTALLIGTGLCADCALYSFWDFKLDATVLNYIDSPKDAVASVSPWYIILGVLAILAVARLLLWLLAKAACRFLEGEKEDKATNKVPSQNKTKTAKPRTISLRLLQTLLLLVMGGMLFLFVRGGVGRSTMNVGRAYYCDNQFLNHSAVNPVFSFFYSSLKVQDFGKEYRFFTPEEASRIWNEMNDGMLHDADTNNIAGNENDTTSPLLLTARPDIVLVLMEGFSAKFIGALGAEKEVAHNLSALCKEGILFSQCYANSFRTDRGTLSILSGYPAFPGVSVMKLPEKSRMLPSIAASLKAAGYSTSFLYGGDINFTNMKSYLLSTGFDDVKGDTHFPAEAAHSNAWGVNDHIVLDTFVRQILQKAAGREPFFSACLTLSSHEPWEVPYHKIAGDMKANSFAYTDSCIGVFVDKLKASTAWNNLLVVFVADHGIPYPEGVTEADPTKHHIPLLMTGGAIRHPLHVSKYCAQTDLAATLLAMLGLPHRQFRFSRNILSTSYRAPYTVHTFVGGVEYIDSTGVTIMDLTGNNTITNISNNPATAQQDSIQRIQRAKAYLQTTICDLDKLGRTHE